MREQAKELAHTLGRAQQERENVQRDVARLTTELAAITEAEKKLAGIQAQLERLRAVSTECEKLEELARMHERRAALQEHRKQLAGEVQQLKVKLEGLRKAPELLKQTTDELSTAFTSLTEAEAEAAKLTTAWNRDVQDVKTKAEHRAEE